jgi:YVTN family beta-propeller protein
MTVSFSARRPPSHRLLIFASTVALVLGAHCAAAYAQPFVLVTEKHSNGVTVIDAATNKVTATIGVDGSPSEIAVSPDGRVAYVANASDKANAVAVIDTTALKVVHTIRSAIVRSA